MSEDLTRFVAAQDEAGTYQRALAELRAGRKTSHWMWFVFPQLAGLGHSATARHFALPSLAAAREYRAHPVLGPRLLECCRAVLDGPTADPGTLLGTVDAMKLRSSMTLFLQADPEEPVFTEVLARCFAGRPDPATDALLTG